MTGEMTSKSGTDDGRLKIAIQKSGRLSEKSFAILEKAGFRCRKARISSSARRVIFRSTSFWSAMTTYRHSL